MRNVLSTCSAVSGRAMSHMFSSDVVRSSRPRWVQRATLGEERFFAPLALCGLHRRQPARAFLGRPRLWVHVASLGRDLSSQVISGAETARPPSCLTISGGLMQPTDPHAGQ